MESRIKDILIHYVFLKNISEQVRSESPSTAVWKMDIEN